MYSGVQGNRQIVSREEDSRAFGDLPDSPFAELLT